MIRLCPKSHTKGRMKSMNTIKQRPGTPAPAVRVQGLDILKALCAFAVVTIHQKFPGRIGICLDALARIAVPIFFMITGYFYTDVLRQRKERTQLRKLLLLWAVSTLLFLVWDVLGRLLLKGTGVKDFLLDIFSAESAYRFLVFNHPPFEVHLWYLSAVVYVLVLVFLVRRLFPRRFEVLLFAASPCLLLLGLLGAYAVPVFHRDFLVFVSRNFLLLGLPCFTAGYFLRQRGKSSHGPGFWLAPILLFSLTTILERWGLRRLGWFSTGEYYISTVPLSIFVFRLFTDPFWNGKLPVLSYWGRELSTDVYILHPAIVTVFSTALKRFADSTVYLALCPFLVYGFSLLAAFLLARCKARRRVNAEGGRQ